MELIKTVRDLNLKISELKKQHKTIGFVPTMGALHSGHLSLVEKAKSENDIVVVSIFVNPTQFGPNEDFTKYPRNLEKDKNLLDKVKTDILFFPEVEDIYPKDNSIKRLTADKYLAGIACGKSRPGHFDGVVTVVARLFDIVKPNRAYFGLKDYQQFLIIKKMAADLKYPIEIIGCPLIREADGLALSSRNSYLSPQERKDALVLYLSLQEAKKLILDGEKDLNKIINTIINRIKKVTSAKIDYMEILDRNNLQPLKAIKLNQGIILLAVYIGNTRLIDNIFI